MYNYTIYDVANWFLANANDVTNKKLQKLVYYAYSWYLVFNNEDSEHIDDRFFENNFEAWIHGAVCPELYAKYKQYGARTIPKYEGELRDFSKDEIDLLNQVCDEYGCYNGNELEDICHQESPWKDTRKGIPANVASNKIISDKLIFDCYSARI